MTAREELKAHLSSWEYAYAMAVTCQRTKDYPVFIEARRRADELRALVEAEQKPMLVGKHPRRGGATVPLHD